MTVASTHITDVDIDRFRRRQLPGDGARRVRRSSRGLRATAGTGSRRAATVAGRGPNRSRKRSAVDGDDHVAESEILAFVDGGLDADATRRDLGTSRGVHGLRR